MRLSIYGYNRVSKISVLLSLFLTFWSNLLNAAPQVLILNSYHKEYKGTDDITEGFSKSILADHPEVVIKTEFLDGKYYSGIEYTKKISDLLTFKYQGKRFDLIFVSDDYAFNILEQTYNALFNDTPVVFAGTNGFDIQRIEHRPHFYGVNELPSFDKTLDLMRQLLPDLKNVYVVYDDGLTGELNSTIFKKQVLPFHKDLNFEFLKGPLVDQLKLELAAAQKHSAVIYFAAKLKDSQGKFYNSNQALSMLVSDAKLPYFGGWEFSLGHGIVGGHLVNLRAHGEKAGEIANKLLMGQERQLIPLSPSPNVSMLDYRYLQRNGLDSGRVKSHFTLINKPLSYYEAHQVKILIVISCLLALSIIYMLVLVIKKDRKLEKMVLTDALTGLNNRRFFEEEAKKIINIARRTGSPLSIAMIDIDNFKKINDSFGHDVGDISLQWFSNIMKQRLRKTDVFCRFGGEEFTLIFPNSSLDQAVLVLDELRKTIEDEKLKVSDSEEINITFSSGVVSWDGEQSLRDIIKSADRYLYIAKKEGRNKVVSRECCPA